MAGKPGGKYRPEVWLWAQQQPQMTWEALAAALTEQFGVQYRRNPLRMAARDHGIELNIVPTGSPGVEHLSIEQKVTHFQARDEVAALKAENRDLIAKLAATQREIEAAVNIGQTPQEYTLKVQPSRHRTTTQVIMWSDWHSEELVRRETVGGLNEFNQKIADQRINACIANSARLMEITAKDAPVDGTILHLGGDFISGNIHSELLENTWARPIDAIIWVQERLMAGIRHLADRTPKLVIVCNIGNHSRITHKTHISTAQGNSLEYFMYHNMRHALRDLSNVDWMIAEGYHLYVDLYGRSLRFHHGDMLKYGGGVGGIFIPANKAISQWNKGRKADMDYFCHFHQLKNGGSFICNGSLIGYNAFAVAIKADYERPYQKFSLYTSTGEVCGEYPIFLD